MAISTARSTARSTAISTATHGKHPRHTTAGRGTTERPTAMPKAWRWPWRGSCRGTSVGCHGWDHGDCHGQNRGTCHGHNRGTCRGSAMYNGKPWPLPWKDPRKATQVPRLLPRTTKKSNNVHLFRAGNRYHLQPTGNDGAIS